MNQRLESEALAQRSWVFLGVVFLFVAPHLGTCSNVENRKFRDVRVPSGRVRMFFFVNMYPLQVLQSDTQIGYGT